jgi:hypothetical protein
VIVILDIKIHIKPDAWIISIYKYQTTYDDFLNLVIPACESVGMVKPHDVFTKTKWSMDDGAFIELIRLRDQYDLSFSYTRSRW